MKSQQSTSFVGVLRRSGPWVWLISNSVLVLLLFDYASSRVSKNVNKCKTGVKQQQHVLYMSCSLQE